MPFEVKIDEKLESTTKIVMPISMDQKYHTGERLQALVEFAKGYNTTILIADGLQKYNLSSEKDALKRGEKFLKKHANLFENALIVDTKKTWEEVKEQPFLKIVRWYVWATIKEDELKKASEVVEEEVKKEFFSETLKKTAEASLNKKSEEDSISYQKEEIKFLLTFSDFDVHIYPKDLNASQKLAYQLFQSSYSLPKIITPKLTNFESHNIAQIGIFKNKKHQNSLPITFRLLLNNIDIAMKSTELAPSAKALFIDQVNQIFASTYLQDVSTNPSLSESKLSYKVGEELRILQK